MYHRHTHTSCYTTHKRHLGKKKSEKGAKNCACLAKIKNNDKQIILEDNHIFFFRLIFPVRVCVCVSVSECVSENGKRSV